MSRSIIKNKIWLEVASGLLILLFLYTAGMKLSEYDKFLDQLQHSPQLSHYAKEISWFIPVAEITIALLLIVPKTKYLGFHLSFLMMLSFTIYIFYMLNYASKVPCACGGVLANLSWRQHLIFNLIYTGIALAGILINKNILSCERTGEAENLRNSKH